MTNPRSEAQTTAPTSTAVIAAPTSPTSETIVDAAAPTQLTATDAGADAGHAAALHIGPGPLLPILHSPNTTATAKPGASVRVATPPKPPYTNAPMRPRTPTPTPPVKK